MGYGRLELGVRGMGKNLKPETRNLKAAVTDANIECREA